MGDDGEEMAGVVVRDEVGAGHLVDGDDAVSGGVGEGVALDGASLGAGQVVAGRVTGGVVGVAFDAAVR